MKLKIKTIKETPCEIILQDLTPYLLEDEDYPLEVLDNYKVSHRVGIDVIQQNRTDGSTIKEYSISEGIVPLKIKIEFDGWGTLHHIVIPNKDWFDWQMSLGEESFLSLYRVVYFSDGGNIYKYVGNEIHESSLEELIEVNPEGTTISKYVEDFVSICLLMQCYVNLSMDLLDKSCVDFHCVDSIKIDTYKRDVVWMAINVIEYLVSLGDYEEAERILENIGGCNGLCKNEHTRSSSRGCGCQA